IESSYFWRKPAKDQKEIIEIIRKLVDRINPKSELLTTQNKFLLKKAKTSLLQLSK
ncbi:MAG: hypothetical protein RLZZ365_380, partial [Pseudomonadota bacterium]